MTVRVMLVSPAMNAALREARFEGDAPLDEAGTRQARAAAGRVPRADQWVRGTSVRCLRTADALGVRSTPQPALADWDMGRWRGMRLADVSDAEPEAVASWLADPSAAPHGGESLSDLFIRVGGWLDGLTERGGRVLAVVEPAVVRAAIVHGTGLPFAAFWRLDVAPLSLTMLSGQGERWNLTCGQPL